jgi:peptidoglycan/LPS O-acetylase OafA/YrhL
MKPGMTSSQASFYRPEIDGLRAVAVLAVLANHIQNRLFPGGFLGVDVFFVISGYVITSSLLHREQTSFSSFILSFYGRRFKRLLPALLVCIFISSLLYCLVVQVPGPSLWTGLAAVFGFSNIQLYSSQADYFASAAELNLFLHTWSLGVEEQFYLLYPLIFWFATKRQRLFKRLLIFAAAVGSVVMAAALIRSGLTFVPGFMRAQGKGPYGVLLMALVVLGFTANQPALLQRRHRGLFLLLGVLSGISLLFFGLLSKANPSAAFYLMTNRFWEMGAGCLLALWADPGLSSERIRGTSQRLRAGSAVLLAMICGSFFLPSLWKSMTTPLVVVLTLLLILAMDFDPESRGLAKRLLSMPLMTSIGLISYSLYLWHWPVLVMARWTIGVHAWSLPFLIGLIAVASLASYRFVEGPLRRARWAPTNRATIGYGLAVETAMAGVLFTLLSQPGNNLYTGKASTPFDLASLAVSGTEITVENCGFFDGKTVEKCLLEAKYGKPYLFLFGDSHAGHLYPLMGEVVARTGVGLVTFNTAGNAHQPFPVISFRRSDGSSNDYLDRLPAKGKEINAFYSLVSPRLRRGDSVLLSSDLYRYFNLRQPDQDPLFGQWRAAIVRLAKELEPRGVNVVVFAPFPHFGSGGGPICTPQWFRPKLSSSCFVHLPVDEVRKERSGIVMALNRLEAEQRNLFIYDPLPLFCPPSSPVCRNHEGNIVFYLDGDHLSPNSAPRVAEDFVPFLRKRGLLP